MSGRPASYGDLARLLAVARGDEPADLGHLVYGLMAEGKAVAAAAGVERGGTQSGNPSRTPAPRSARVSRTEPAATITTAEMAIIRPRTS